MSIYIGNNLEDRLKALETENASLIKYNFYLFFFIFHLKSSKTHTSAAPLLLKKGAEVKMKLQDLKLLIDKKH